GRRRQLAGLDRRPGWSPHRVDANDARWPSGQSPCSYGVRQLGAAMKIAGLKTFVANVSRTNFVFVKIYTDEGIDGVGEATLEWKTLAVVAALEELERQLVGRDPFQSDALVEQLHRDSYWRTGAVFRTALGAVEAAMLDIKGKA